jgi:RNA polymerase sigma factor (sigma-70 family)
MNTEQLFATLVRTNEGIVHKAYGLYCHKDYPLDDYMQDVALQAWTSFPRFSRGSRFSTWLFSIAKFTAIGILKKTVNGIRTVPYDHPYYQMMAEFVYDESEKAEKLIQYINERNVEKLISMLSEREQDLLLLYASGKSYSEIADVLKQDENVLRVHIHRIKGRLRKQFTNVLKYED